MITTDVEKMKEEMRAKGTPDHVIETVVMIATAPREYRQLIVAMVGWVQSLSGTNGIPIPIPFELLATARGDGYHLFGETDMEKGYLVLNTDMPAGAFHPNGRWTPANGEPAPAPTTPVSGPVFICRRQEC